MATFTYSPDWGASPKGEPRIRSIRFGDGYEQTTPDGLNPYLPEWSLTFSKRPQAEATAIFRWFATNNAGYTRFDWAPPGDGTATNEPLGTGDGSRTTWTLTALGRACTVVGTPTITRTDWQGTQQLYATARTNRALWSEDYSNAAWAKIGLAVTANAVVAPDGAMTMDKLVGTSGVTSYAQQNGSTVASTNYTESIYVAAFDATTSAFKIWNSAVTVLVAQLVIAWNAGIPSFSSSSGPGYVGYSIIPMGGGIYRISITFNSGANTTTARAFYPNNANTATGVYAWGSHFALASEGQGYIPTNTTAVTVTDIVVSGAGMVTFGQVPVSGAVLTWSGSYTRRHIAKWTPPKPDDWGSWSITADLREVAL